MKTPHAARGYVRDMRGLGFRVWDYGGLGVWGLGTGVWDLGFRDTRVWGLGFKDIGAWV